MFNNQKENEGDFCESYKSQILNQDSEEDKSLFNSILKIITIVLLLAIVIAVSIYGFNYINNNATEKATPPPVSVQISDDDLVVTIEDEEPVVEEVLIKKEELVKEEVVIPKEEIILQIEEPVEEKIEIKTIEPISIIQESDIDKIANDVKLAISQSEKIAEKENLKIEEVKQEEPSLEVPTSTSSLEAQYLEELAKLSEEIDKERE